MSQGRPVPASSSALTEEAISFCTEVIDSSGVAEEIEKLIKKRTGRPRALKVRALFVVLLLLAMDDRPLHLKAATKVLFCKLAGPWRAKFGINGDASGRKAFLARYRQVRYLFHLVLSVIDPSVEAKDRVLALPELAAMREELSKEEVLTRQARLEKLVADMLEASVRVCSPEELAGFDGSVGLDATPVPLWSRGPSARRGTCASDPDGGWYIREGDHREGSGPDGKALRKILLGPRSHGRDDGAAPWCGPGFPQPRPRRVAREAGRRTRGDRGTAIGTGPLPGLAGWVLGSRPGLYPVPARALPPARAGTGLLAGDGLQGGRARPAGQ